VELERRTGGFNPEKARIDEVMALLKIVGHREAGRNK
jgi:hypothetical protein